MFPAIVLIPLFLVAGAFWAFGPAWSWIPFNAIYWLFTLITLAAKPSRLVIAAPMAAQSASSTFSLTLLLSIGIAVVLFFDERYWELIPCGAVFLASGFVWPRLRTLGPI